MVGVLIVVGILGYGLVYSGLSQLPNPVVSPPQGTLEALWPGHGSKGTGAPNRVPGKPVISTSSTGNRGRARTT